MTRIAFNVLAAAAALVLAASPGAAGEADPDTFVNPGAVVRNAPQVGPAVRLDDHRLGCKELAQEYAWLGQREAELAGGSTGYTRRESSTGALEAVTSVIGGLEGLGTALSGLFQVNREATHGDTVALGRELDAVRARRAEVARLSNDKKC